MKPPYKINQLKLSTSIMSELSRQVPNMPVDSEIFNACIKAADLVVAECARERVEVMPGMSISQWFDCDDTGASSRYMACKMDAGKTRLPLEGYEYPHDSDDFGRCLRMVRACGFEDKVTLLYNAGPEWQRIVNRWGRLVNLYDTANVSVFNEFLRSLIEDQG
ncbi:hypothetical protein HWV00_20995 (plasmid) [Moritella sp. 24]|uniref:hypothetical protein n=1 Tax=Moritella sp. 24 TaxID=2746230 RepID=UPI001BA76453|nr:hypothetical protein [Moritella sp. 24]QUM78752.1 hypothetical protein HWV00_20995 [Moritella sp. 24]